MQSGYRNPSKIPPISPHFSLSLPGSRGSRIARLALRSHHHSRASGHCLCLQLKVSIFPLVPTRKELSRTAAPRHPSAGMRSLWLAAAAAATAASGMSAPLTAASTARVPRILGGAISRARLVGGSRRSRSSVASTGSSQGFVLPPCTDASKTSTWGSSRQEEHETAAVSVRSRRPRSVARGTFWDSLIASKRGVGSRPSQQRLFSAQPAASGVDSAAVVQDGVAAEAASAAAAAAINGGRVEEEGEEEPAPFKVTASRGKVQAI